MKEICYGILLIFFGLTVYDKESAHLRKLLYFAYIAGFICYLIRAIIVTYTLAFKPELVYDPYEVCFGEYEEYFDHPIDSCSFT